MQLTQNKNYTLTAESPLLIFISNEKLIKGLVEEGFTNVQVVGSGSKRTASGHWPLPTKEYVIPKKFEAFIKKIEAV